LSSDWEEISDDVWHKNIAKIAVSLSSFVPKMYHKVQNLHHNVYVTISNVNTNFVHKMSQIIFWGSVSGNLRPFSHVEPGFAKEISIRDEGNIG